MTKTGRFMASLVELNHKYIAFKKRATPKADELRVSTQPRSFLEGSMVEQRRSVSSPYCNYRVLNRPF